MKTKDIKPGVVYGYRRRVSDPVIPVVFVAQPGPDQLYSEVEYRQNTTPVFYRRNGARKPRLGRGYGDKSVGYPAVIGHAGTDPAGLLKVTLDDFLATTRAYDEGRQFAYSLVVNPAHVLGPHDEAVAEDKLIRAAPSGPTGAARTGPTLSNAVLMSARLGPSSDQLVLVADCLNRGRIKPPLDLKAGPHEAAPVGPVRTAVINKRQREATQRRYEKEFAAREAAQKRADRLIAALGQHGVIGSWNIGPEPTALVIPLHAVEKLLGLLDARAEEMGSL